MLNSCTTASKRGVNLEAGLLLRMLSFFFGLQKTTLVFVKVISASMFAELEHGEDKSSSQAVSEQFFSGNVVNTNRTAGVSTALHLLSLHLLCHAE